MSASFEKRFNMLSESRKDTTSYSTQVINPESLTASKAKYKMPKTDILDGDTSYILFDITSVGADAYSSTISGLYAIFAQFTVLTGGTQIASVPINCSAYMVINANQSREMMNNPQKAMYQQGRQVRFEGVANANGYEVGNWVPDTSITYTQSAATTFSLMLPLTVLSNLFKREVPLYAMEDPITIELDFKPSSSYNDIMVPSGGETGYTIASTQMVLNLLKYPDPVMNAMREMPLVLPIDHVMCTSKAVSSSTKTIICMQPSNLHVKTVYVSLPRTGAIILGSEDSYVDAADNMTVNINYNGKQYFPQPVKASRQLYSIAKECSPDNELWAPVGTFLKESSGGLGDLLDVNVQPWGSSTEDIYSGSFTYLSFSFQIDATAPDSFQNATKFDTSNLEVVLTHNAGIEALTPVAYMWVVCQKMLQIDVASGHVNVLESL